MSKAAESRFYDIHRLELLKELAEALNEANDIDAAMAAILPRLSEVLGLSTAWAFRYDAKRRCFVEVGASGLPPALAVNHAAPLKTGWCECQDQFIEGKLDRAVNLVTCSRLRNATGDKNGLVCHASIPLRSKGRPLGILNVAASGRKVFTDESLALLGAIGHQVAVAIDRASILGNERGRASQLKLLSELAMELLAMVNPDRILQHAVDRYVALLGYEACGVLVRVPQSDESVEPLLVAAAHRNVSLLESREYTYEVQEPGPLLAEHERVLLPDARSAIEKDIPHTEYVLRVESSDLNRFSELDDDVLNTFVWHLAAVLENAHLYQKSVDSAKWSERRQLAADLHDSVSQRLFSASLLTKSASGLLASLSHQATAATNPPIGDHTKLPETADALRETMDRIQGLIRESQEEMRALIEALRPQAERNFAEQIRVRIDPLQLQSDIRIHCNINAVIDDLATEPGCVALLCGLDEALQNALKHAHAKNIYVTVGMSESSILMTVQDDGCGYDVNQRLSGLGSLTMQERMARVGGRTHISSKVGSGTTAIFELPISKHENQNLIENPGEV